MNVYNNKYLVWLIKVYCIGFCFGTEAVRDLQVLLGVGMCKFPIRDVKTHT